MGNLYVRLENMSRGGHTKFLEGFHFNLPNRLWLKVKRILILSLLLLPMVARVYTTRARHQMYSTLTLGAIIRNPYLLRQPSTMIKMAATLLKNSVPLPSQKVELSLLTHLAVKHRTVILPVTKLLQLEKAQVALHNQS